MSANAESFEQIIDSLATGTRLVTRLSLATPPAALTHIQKMLDSLRAHPPGRDIYLDVLEQLRPPLHAAMKELVPLCRDKPLPLIDRSEAIFLQITETLRKMHHGYGDCAQFIKGAPHGNKDAEFTRSLALTLYRGLYYASLFVCEHYYARQALPPGAWQEVHHYYAEAEQRDLADKQVMDTLEGEQAATNCTNLYVALLLVDITNPYSYDVRDQLLIRHWATLWASHVSIFPVESVLEIPPFIIDLEQDKPLHPASNSMASDNARHLDTFGLTAQISETHEMLKHKSVDPAQLKPLNLGDTSTGHACRLLTRLSAPWGLSASPRRFRRHSAEHGQARLCSSFEHIHRAVSGEEFRQPGAFGTPGLSPLGSLRQNFDTVDAIAATGRWRPPQTSTFPTSVWNIVNYSANGFRLARPLSGQQVAHGQLVALSQNGSPHYLLGEVRWLMQDTNEDCLHMGVTMFPGVPQAGAVRPEDLLQGAGEPYLRILLLPGFETTKTPPTLVLPVGMYRSQRSLSLAQGDSIQRVILEKLWQRGLDFEIVSYKSYK
ncbi:MAG: hypothetical protein LBQ81_10280 [Zoogloeaceae bacterium]|jgi:hypothetical protein|nr:hypothetical protein [Zoogloeaceae bacterium]